MDKINALAKLNESYNIEGYVNYIEYITSKYSFDEIINNKLKRDLKFIKNKLKDENLNLSIIGEFSSGKSTFIDALLRDNILETDVVQGTTTSSTVIKYSPEYTIDVKYKDVDGNLLKPNFFQKFLNKYIKSIIKKFTTGEDEEHRIREVWIGHPAEILKKGIIIIDTPGTNAIERWHEEATKIALRDLSDVSIILMSSDKPLPKTLINFIKSNLGDILPKCIFVVTKMDLVRKKEREKQIEYIKQRISYELDIKDPVVLPYTPLLVLGEEDKELKDEITYNRSDYEELIKESYNTEEIIYKKLLVERINIQLLKIILVLTNVLDYVSEDVNDMVEKYQQEHDELIKATKVDLREFTIEEKKIHINNFKNKIGDIKNTILDEFNSDIEIESDNIYSQFDLCENLEQIKEFSESTLPKMLSDSASFMLDSMNKKIEVVNKIAKNEIDEFLIDFKEMYDNLKTLKISKNYSNLFDGSDIINKNDTSHNKKSNNLSNYLDDEIDKENLIIGGSAIGGAVLGQMLIPIPVIGAVVGGLLGGVISTFFGPSFEEKKNDCKKKIESIVEEYFEKIYKEICKEIDSYIEENLKYIEKEIDKYLSNYEKVVKRLINKDREREEELYKKISDIKLDLASIDEKRNSILKIKEGLNINEI